MKDPYWRPYRWDPPIEYARLEDVHLWPGEGPCVDGFFYWITKGSSLSNPETIVKRIPLEEWRARGYRKREAREKGDRPAMRLELFMDSTIKPDKPRITKP